MEKKLLVRRKTSETMLSQPLSLSDHHLLGGFVGREKDLSSIQVLVLEEPLVHVEGVEGLEGGGFVTRTLDGGIGVFLENFNVTSGGSVDEPRLPGAKEEGVRGRREKSKKREERRKKKEKENLSETGVPWISAKQI